jgi:hypothetical protein
LAPLTAHQKPLKRLAFACRGSTGLKAGVNDNANFDRTATRIVINDVKIFMAACASRANSVVTGTAQRACAEELLQHYAAHDD